MTDFKLLEKLCTVEGISGDEGSVREIIINEIKPFADEIKTDNLGNIIVFKKGKNRAKAKLMLSAHMDEVGFMVTDITSDGYLKFDEVGGLDRRVVLGKTVTVGKNKVNGVIGVKPIHLSKSDEDIIRIEGGIPRIVSDELWNEVNMQMKDRTMNARHKAKRTYLLSGIIYCGECVSPMSGNARRAGRNKTEYITYDCNRRHRERTCRAKGINKKYIEDLVISHLENEFFTQENVLQLSQRIFNLQAQRKMEVTPELAALKAELAAKQKEMNNIIDSIKKGGYKDWMGDLGDEIDARIKYLEGKIQYSESIQERQILSQEQIYDYIMKDANLMEKSLEDLKQIVQTYVEKVVVFAEKIEIHLIINNHNPGGKSHPDCGYDGGSDFFRFISTIELLNYRHRPR